MLPPQTMFFRPPARGLQGVRDRFWLSGEMKRLSRDIEHRGWSPAVPQLPQDRGARCVHSVGFTETLNQPELIIFDTPAPIAFQELDFAFEGLRREQLELRDGSTWLKEAGRPLCVVRKVHPSQLASWLGLANERRLRLTNDGAALEAFQLVLADRQGFLPWEPGYDEAGRKWQPALYEAAARHTEVAATPSV